MRWSTSSVYKEKCVLYYNIEAEVNMKKIIYYPLSMVIIIILLPVFIVNSCSLEQENIIENGYTDKIKIKVYIDELNNIEEMYLEEYIEGVVAAEMPAEFELEALKAQAVAARTYAYARIGKNNNTLDERHHGADICTDSTHCQAWISKENALNKWAGSTAVEYWDKIEKSVHDTQNIIIVFDNDVANPVFHSNSGGMTENAEDVWEGEAVPYLISVISEGEDAYSEHMTTVFLNKDVFKSKMEDEFPDIEINLQNIINDIQITEYTEGGRVKNIRIGNMDIKGTDIRRNFSLKSANFKIEESDENTLKITTYGNGHGVGMSQWGANYLAKNGADYAEIIKYYYSGVELQKIDSFVKN